MVNIFSLIMIEIIDNLLIGFFFKTGFNRIFQQSCFDHLMENIVFRVFYYLIK